MNSRARLVVAFLAIAGCGSPPPPSSRPAPPPPSSKDASGVAWIDTALRDAWKKAGITPSQPADDATFLRRAYIDVVGTIPPPDVTRAFLESRDADKRSKLVSTLLASPAYARHWTNYWDAVLMGRSGGAQAVDRVAFRAWLQSRIASNAPWDAIVRELVSATGQNSNGGKRVGLAQALAMGDSADDADASEDDAAEENGVNGAVNFGLRFEKSPNDLAGTASRIFLGVQIQCAECHDHKTERWTQNDFRSFAAAFFHARVEPLDRGKAMGQQRRVVIRDLDRVAPRIAKNPDLTVFATTKARALDGTDLEKGASTRQALAAWMTSPKNPWFAKAIVNRMWGHFLGRGFYDPVDDMRTANEPVLVDLLDRIAQDFVAHRFDLQHLVRTITSTEAYRLAAGEPPAANADPENKSWARFHVVPLGSEELLNAIVFATDAESTAMRGRKNIGKLRLELVRKYAFLFDVDEVDDTPDYTGGVVQALAMLNGQLVGGGSRALPGSALEGIVRGASTEDSIDALVVRVLARHATAEERKTWSGYVGSGPADKRRAAFEDVMWALLNSSEFAFNH